MNEYESKSKVDLREKLSGKKVYLKSILPTAQMLRALRSTYTSSLVSLKEFKNKLYVDEIFGHETPVAEVSYGVLKGDWLIDEEIDEYTGNPLIIFTDNKSGQSMKLAFPNLTHKLIFLNEMYVSTEVKQNTPGMDISSVVNKNALYPKKKKKTDEVKESESKKKSLISVAVGTVAAGLGYLIYSKNRKKNG